MGGRIDSVWIRQKCDALVTGMVISAKEIGFKVWYVLSWFRIGSNMSGCCGHDVESRFH
jgi:hypothetical protein